MHYRSDWCYFDTEIKSNVNLKPIQLLYIDYYTQSSINTQYPIKLSF